MTPSNRAVSIPVPVRQSGDDLVSLEGEAEHTSATVGQPAFGDHGLDGLVALRRRPVCCNIPIGSQMPDETQPLAITRALPQRQDMGPDRKRQALPVRTGC